MPKLGDIRSDGRVYAGRNKSFKSGEYWATRDQFLRLHGADWFERRARMDENVRLRAIEKAAVAEREKDRARVRAEREALEALKPKRGPRRVFASDDERRLARMEYEASRRASESYKARRAGYDARNKEDAAKRNPHRLLCWGMRVLGSINRERGRLVGSAIREMDRHKARMEREMVAKTRIPRVMITPEQRIARRRADRKNHKHRRRALLRGMEAKATAKQISEIKKLAKGRCFYCRAKTKVLTLDHIVSLAKGGGHTVDNIVFACHACNSEKRDLDPADYAKRHGMLLV